MLDNRSAEGCRKGSPLLQARLDSWVKVPECCGRTAAQQNHLRIEDIDEHCDTTSEMRAHLVEYLLGHFVLCVCRFRNSLRVEGIVLMRGRGSSSKMPFGDLEDTRGAHIRLQTSVPTTTTRFPSEFDLEVT